jgi:hypothetical protein
LTWTALRKYGDTYTRSLTLEGKLCYQHIKITTISVVE